MNLAAEMMEPVEIWEKAGAVWSLVDAVVARIREADMRKLAASQGPNLDPSITHIGRFPTVFGDRLRDGRRVREVETGVEYVIRGRPRGSRGYLQGHWWVWLAREEAVVV